MRITCRDKYKQSMVYADIDTQVKTTLLLMERGNGSAMPTDLGGGTLRENITSTAGNDLREREREGGGGAKRESGCKEGEGELEYLK